MKKQPQDEIRRLRDQVSSLLASGKRKEAVASYEQLTLLEPSSGDWPRRAADVYGELGRPDDQRRLLLAALRAYGRSGQVLKAIAMGKLVQRLFADDVEAARELALIETPAPPRHFARPGAPLRHFRPPAPAPAASPEQAVDGASASPDTSPPSVPPSRRASVRPEASPPSARTVPGSRAIPSVLPASSSLSPHSILALGAPPDPPGVVSLDADDLIGIVSLAPGSLARGSLETGSLEATSLAATSLAAADLVSVAPDAVAGSAEAALVALAGARLFSELDIAQRQRLVETVQLVTLSAGEVLFEQGEVASTMYVVALGEVTAQVATLSPGGTLELAVLGPGEFFGEIGLFGEQPRQATIVAKTDVYLLAFPADSMTRLAESDDGFRLSILRFLRERLVETLMLTSPLFQPFGIEDRAKLQGLFRFVEIADGTTLLEEGRKADGLYVLLAGEVVVRRGSGDQEVLLGVLGPGDVFGEMSLLHQKPAMASVTARTRCYALRLPDRYFMEVLMTHPVLMEHIATLGATRAEQNAALLDPARTLEDAHVTLF